MQAGDFPSLAKRSYEDETPIVADQDEVAAAVAELPEPLREQVTEALRESATAHRLFLSNLPVVREKVSKAQDAAVSSESWVVAQMELAALETQRAPSISALADLDRLYFERLDAETDDEQFGGAVLIDKGRAQVRQQVAQQQREIDTMKQGLR